MCSNAEGPGRVKKLFIPYVTTQAQPHSHRSRVGSPGSRGSTGATCWQGRTSSIMPVAPQWMECLHLILHNSVEAPYARTLPCLSAHCSLFSTRVPTAKWRESWGIDGSPLTPPGRLEGPRPEAAIRKTALFSVPAELRSASCGLL